MPASKYWIGGTAGNTGNWSTAANWSDGAVPVTGDTVVIDGRSTYAITAGLSQSAVTLAKLTIVLGSPAVGTTSAPLAISATILDVNVPPTDGSQPGGAATINIDTGSNAATVTVYGSRSSGDTGLEPVIWKGAHASNVLYVRGGKVGVATCLPGDTATLPTAQLLGDDAALRLSSGVTATTVTQTGGTLLLECAATTVNQDGGTLETRGTGAITTLYANGTARLNSTGTVTNLYVEPAGEVDFTGNTAARTVTNATVTGGGRVNAALPVVSGSGHPIAFTNGVDCIRGARSGQVDFGGDITVTPSAV